MGPVLPRYRDQPIREAGGAAEGTAQLLGPLGSGGLSASTPQVKGARAAGAGCAQPTCKARPARARGPALRTDRQAGRPTVPGDARGPEAPRQRSALPVGSATEARVLGLPRLAHATPKTRGFEKKRRVLLLVTQAESFNHPAKKNLQNPDYVLKLDKNFLSTTSRQRNLASTFSIIIFSLNSYSRMD